MKNPLVVGVAVGVAVIALLVAGAFYVQRGAHIELTGQVLKVRTAPVDEHSSMAVVDFRFTNPADYAFVVRSVTVVLEDKGGKETEGSTIAEDDTQLVFDSLPLLGHKFNRSLIARDKIKPHDTDDRMVAARFEIPHDAMEARKRFVLRIEEVDGAVSEIGER